MMQTLPVPLEPLSAAAFAAFGEVIGEPDGPAAFEVAHMSSWRQAFECDGPVELMFCRYRHQPMTFTLLERHANVTQAFIPLAAVPWVMVVGGSAADDAAPPRGDSVRAFLARPGHGVMLRRNAWHALTRFPVRPEGAAFALITGRTTQAELQRQLRDGTRPTLTEVVDLKKQSGIGFEVVDPDGLLAQA